MDISGFGKPTCRGIRVHARACYPGLYTPESLLVRAELPEPNCDARTSIIDEGKIRSRKNIILWST